MGFLAPVRAPMGGEETPPYLPLRSKKEREKTVEALSLFAYHSPGKAEPSLGFPYSVHGFPYPFLGFPYLVQEYPYCVHGYPYSPHRFARHFTGYQPPSESSTGVSCFLRSGVVCVVFSVCRTGCFFCCFSASFRSSLVMGYESSGKSSFFSFFFGTSGFSFFCGTSCFFCGVSCFFSGAFCFYSGTESFFSGLVGSTATSVSCIYSVVICLAR